MRRRWPIAARLARYLFHPQRVVESARVSGELSEGVEKLRLEGAAFLSSFGSNLASPTEVGEGVRDSFGSRSADGGDEAPDDRGRSATAPNDVAHEGVPIGDGHSALAVAHVVGLSGGGDGYAESTGSLHSRFPGVARQALDAAHLGGEAREGGYLAGVAADGGDLEIREETLGRLGAERRRPGADRIQDHRYVPLVGSPAGEQHGLDEGRVQGAYVYGEGGGESYHLLDLLVGVRHDR